MDQRYSAGSTALSAVTKRLRRSCTALNAEDGSATTVRSIFGPKGVARPERARFHR
jgi:hypothetical protein